MQRGICRICLNIKIFFIRLPVTISTKHEKGTSLHPCSQKKTLWGLPTNSTGAKILQNKKNHIKSRLLAEMTQRLQTFRRFCHSASTILSQQHLFCLEII